MQTNEINEQRQSWARRWYSFNKQKIPMIFIVIGTLFFTAFLDFEVQGTDIKLQSHIASLKLLLDTPLNNLATFFLFAIYLISLIQLFNAFTFSKKQSPFGLILITVLTVVQCVLVGLYTNNFFVEQATRTDYIIPSFTRFSYSVFLIGTVFFIIGTVFAWFYVNWKYVKETE
ncbi:MAG: hypothetical protein PHI01_04315 [Candidatus Izemoplasmatales bacterium]|nr:hypothetical protein [Candidatus Izemoplasmatales bacterium]